MKIEIPFNNWSKERLKQGKHATTRIKKYGEVGDTFTVDGMTYGLHFVGKCHLQFISFFMWKTEGAKDEIEFINVWEKIHPRKGFDPEQLVWFHYFTEKTT